jgi:50S ribosomal protein L16 3-hydroxylase
MFMETDYMLSPDYWSSFVKDYWKQRPLLLRQPFAPPLGSSDEVFQALVAACDHYRKSGRGGLKFYVENRQVATDVRSHLPHAEDKSFAGYNSRISERLGGRDFILHLVDLHAYDARLLARVRAFISGLVRLVGVPACKMDLEIFLGKYQRTPGGVHKEGCANFHFVVDGRKRMLVWVPGHEVNEADFMVNKPGLGDYDEEQYLDSDKFEEALGEPVAMDAEAGDAFYWPAGVWHVAESPEVNLSMNIALYMDGQPLEIIEAAAAKLAAGRLGEANHAPRYAFPAGGNGAELMPEVLTRSIDALREVSQAASLKDAVAVEWLKRLTGLGFEVAPPRLRLEPLTDETLVRGSRVSPVLWAPLHDGQLSYVANGYSSTVPSSPNVISLLQAVNSENVTAVRALVEEHANGGRGNGDDGASRELLRQVVDDLYSMQAIVREY